MAISLGPPAAPCSSQAPTRRETTGDYDASHFPGPSAAPSGSQVTRSEARGEHDGRQGLAVFRDFGSSIRRREARRDCDGRQGLALFWTRQHHPVPKLKECRQENIVMRQGSDDFPDSRQHPASKLQEGRQDHHPVPKLQEGKQEEIMMGGKDWQFSWDAGSTTHCPSYKKADKRRF